MTKQKECQECRHANVPKTEDPCSTCKWDLNGMGHNCLTNFERTPTKYNKMRDELEKKAHLTTRQLKQDKAQYDKVEAEADKAVADIEAQIKALKKKRDAIEAPYIKRLKKIRANIDKREDYLRKPWGGNYKAMKEVGYLECYDTWIADGKLTIDTAEGAFSHLGININVDPMDREDTEGGRVYKPLPNGIQIVMTRDYDEVFNFAVYKGKILGLHYCRRSQHPGDESEYMAWFGQTKYRSGRYIEGEGHPNNQLEMEVTRKNKYFGTAWSHKNTKEFETFTTKHILFKEWKQMVKEADPTKVKAVDTTDKASLTVMNKGY